MGAMEKNERCLVNRNFRGIITKPRHMEERRNRVTKDKAKKMHGEWYRERRDHLLTDKKIFETLRGER